MPCKPTLTRAEPADPPRRSREHGLLASRDKTGPSDGTSESGLFQPLVSDRRVSRLPAVSSVIQTSATWMDPPCNPAAEPDVTLSVTEDCCREASCDAGPCSRLPWRSRLASFYHKTKNDVVSDHRRYYRWSTARDLLLGVAGGSLLANTSMDADFRDWLQDDVRSRDGEDFAAFWKGFGEGKYVIPSFIAMSLVGQWLDEVPIFDVAGEFGDRIGRSYAVGAPPLVFMQACLGGSRPGESSHGSQWRSFEDRNGVSGHAFIGAVPFITAANMLPNRGAKACFYFMSMLPAWSRVNDDSHYLSQACLGWWMGYLACRAIDETEAEKANRCFAVAPMVEPDTFGLMAVYQR